MPSKIIIGLVGPLASGKGTVAEYLKEKYQAAVYGFSTPLRDIVNRLHLPIVRENLDNLSTILRQQFGQDILSQTITKDIAQDQNSLVILDGIRRLTDISSAQQLPNFYLVRVIADEQLRYERILQRGQNIDDRSKTLAEFQEDNRSESNIQIPEVMTHAQYEIDNNGDLAAMQQQVDALVAKLRALQAPA